MFLARQPSLLDVHEQPEHDTAFTGVQRVPLDRGAWVDVVRGWVRGHEALFDAVLDAADWQVWMRRMYDRDVAQPRLSTSWVDVGLPAPLRPIADMAESLSVRYGEPLRRISANLYRNGADSVAWHGDTHLRELPTATVAVLSLGHPRPFRLRPRDGGRSIGLDLGRGDLVVMGGTCQRTWQHAVPKVASAGPRICVMFRSAAFDPPAPRAAG